MRRNQTRYFVWLTRIENALVKKYNFINLHVCSYTSFTLYWTFKSVLALKYFNSGYWKGINPWMYYVTQKLEWESYFSIKLYWFFGRLNATRTLLMKKLIKASNGKPDRNNRIKSNGKKRLQKNGPPRILNKATKNCNFVFKRKASSDFYRRTVTLCKVNVYC